MQKDFSRSHGTEPFFGLGSKCVDLPMGHRDFLPFSCSLGSGRKRNDSRARAVVDSHEMDEDTAEHSRTQNPNFIRKLVFGFRPSSKLGDPLHYHLRSLQFC